MGWNDAVKRSQLQPGQWKCAACYVTNQDEVSACVSCETDRPGHAGAKAAAAKAAGAVSAAGFSFGGGAAKPAAGGGTGFSFGGGAAAAKKPAAGGTGFKFGGAAGAAKPAAAAGGSTGFAFGGAKKAEPAKVLPAKAAAPAKGWADMLAQKKDNEKATWKCGACYVPNQIGVVICVSCDTPKPGAEGEVKAAAAAKLAASGISFGKPAAAKPAAAAGGGEAPAKRAKVEDNSVTVVFAAGKLGLSFVKDSSPAVIKGLTDQAAEQDDLAMGMVLTKVAGADVSAKSYSEAVALIKAADRPLELTFRPPGFGGGVAAAGGGAAAAASEDAMEEVERPWREENKFRVGVTTGRVLMCGSGECGQLGFGMKLSEIENARHLSVFDRKSIVNVAAGGMHTLALDSDGAVWSWGCNDDWTLGRGMMDEGVPRKLTDMPKGDPVVQLAAGACHSAVLTRSHTVYSWGTYKDSNGHIGFKVVDGECVMKQQLPAVMEELQGKGVCQIACGSHHTAALTKDGNLYCWGNAEDGQIGRVVSRETKADKRKGLACGAPINLGGGAAGGGSKKRKAVDTSKIIVSVACGSFHTLCLDDEGNVITFGLNNYGQCGTGDMISPVTTPNVIACERLSGVQNVMQLAAGEHHSLALHKDGSVSAWGRGDYSQLGLGQPPRDKALSQRSLPEKCYPRHVTQPAAISISAGDSHSMLIADDGALFTWGFGEMGACCSGNFDDVHIPTEVDPTENFARSAEGAQVMAASAGGLHTVMLVTN